MLPRVVRARPGANPPLVICYHLTAQLDGAILSALGSLPAVINVTGQPGKGLYRNAGIDLSEVLTFASHMVGYEQGPLILVGFSEGCQALRSILLSGGTPTAVVAIDGTHGDWPTRQPWQLESWRGAFERACQDNGCLFAASHSGLTYVESLKPPHIPYASSWRVLREVTGWPLAVSASVHQPVISREGGAVVYSTDSQDHVAQATGILPRILRDEVRPLLSRLVGSESTTLPPAVPSPPPASQPQRLPAVRTPHPASEVGEALASVWPLVLGGPPPSRDSVALLLAQWALETGRGKSMYANNLGNVKSRPGDGRSWCFFPCNELLSPAEAQRLVASAPPREDGQGPSAVVTSTPAGKAVVWFYPPHAACRFRAFETLQEGAADYLRLLADRFASAWAHVLVPDPQAFVLALKAKGYFTADVAPYLKAVASLYQEYQALDFSLPPGTGAEGSCPDGLCQADRSKVLALVSSTLSDSISSHIQESFRGPSDLGT